MNSSNLRQRSYPCNRELLISLRQRRQWTQIQLAEAAGYSNRLISKAESGKPISYDAIEVLAETLSTSTETIHPEDLMCDPVQRAKEFILAMYQHQQNTIDHIRHFLDENVEFRVAGEPTEIPFAGVFRGIDAAKRLFGLFFSVMEVPPNHDPMTCLHFVGNETDVVVWGESWLHPKGRPLASPMPITHLLRFRQGKMYYLEDRFDVFEGIRLFHDSDVD